MKEKLIGSIEDIQAQPEKYRRVWEVWKLGKLDEGLYLILPMSLSTNFFLHYQNGEVFLTDNMGEEKPKSKLGKINTTNSLCPFYGFQPPFEGYSKLH